MSYLVLARKYRPETFADIVGQEHVVRTLQNAIRLGRVHHAFLFTGARGVGKTTTARVLARALSCDAGPTCEPCGQCPACRDIGSGASPDMVEIDGASNTGVDNIRELRENVRYLPSRGRLKLYIIDEVHMLSTAAFNALLKTLEEPPPHVKFMFATTDPQRIPLTILSRCQRFDFRRVSVQVLSAHVRDIVTREQVKLSNTAVAAIAREARGSIRDALSLLDQVLSYGGGDPDDEQVVEALGIVDRQSIARLAEAILTRQAQHLLDMIAQIDTRGHDQADVASLLVEHVRDLMVVSLVEAPGESLLDRSPGEINELQKQSKLWSRPDVHRLFAGLVRVAEDVSRSAFPRVSLEMGLLRLLEIEPSHGLADLLRRLDTLTGGAGSPSDSGSRSGGTSSAPVGGGTRQGPAPQTGSPMSGAAPTTSEPRKVVEDEKPPKPDEAAVPSQTHADSGASEPCGEQALEGWRQTVDRLRSLRPALASVLEHGHVLAFGRDGVEIGFAAGTYFMESVSDRDNSELIHKTIREQLGEQVAIKLKALKDTHGLADRSLARSQDLEKEQKLSEIRAGAMSEPMVVSATKILGGQVKDIVPLKLDDAG